MEQVRWYYSNEEKQWASKQGRVIQDGKMSLWLDGNEYQEMMGFGGCFNELGYEALSHLDSEDQEALLKELFLPSDEGANLNFCRLPMGANDYSKSWYSLNETPGDYGMKKFSIERDKNCLIPYIKRAMEYCPDLKLFASPWSPPTWMKNPPVYNWGKLIPTEENLQAYALYFALFVENYEREGIHIDQVHVQNEPVANQKFPSCMWTGAELRDFIKGYLGPTFEQRGLDTEIWLGTINAPGCDYNRLLFDKWAAEDYDYFANTVLSDEEALQYITGVSYQWGGKIAVQRTFESWWPRIRLMQSENECGFGDNTWEYARYNWTMMKHYISNGAESYMYWNIMLEPMGTSTWGDPQNAMVTIDPVDRRAIFNPDFYVMKHFSSVVRRGAVRLGAKGRFAGDTVAFRNPDGTIVLVVFNPFQKKQLLITEINGKQYEFELEALSINSIVI
ncbi:MAG: glycoside hydrolase family 30 protein [Firmicutes bacterium]|nr:glycoside hydrolase family 30 protein [Bacillota bacterium]